MFNRPRSEASKRYTPEYTRYNTTACMMSCVLKYSTMYTPDVVRSERADFGRAVFHIGGATQDVGGGRSSG